MSEHRVYIRKQLAKFRPLTAEELGDLKILLAPGVEAAKTARLARERTPTQPLKKAA